MKISRILFKPKWQDKDAVVRAAAVAGDSTPELIAALPELTRSDSDARVRLAALKRLGDYERWRERSTGDPDPGLRATARATYIGMLCVGGENTPALSRQIAELETLTAGEIDSVVTTAANRDLRIAALGYIKRPALLAERAVVDPDASLRMMALARIDEPAALERIAERARKSDKIVSRAAREKLASLQINSGNAAAISLRARALCERIEALLREPAAVRLATRAVIEKEWAGLGSHVPDELATRFRGGVALLDRIAAEPQVAPAMPPASDPIPAAQEPAEAKADPPETQDGDGAQADGSAADQPPADLEVSAPEPAAAPAARKSSRISEDQRRLLLNQIEELIPTLEQELDAGDVAEAQSLHARIADLGREAGKIPAALEARLVPVHARVAELRRWQHWSNQRRRRALCDEIEKLAAAALHPDAIATRIREAREEWQRLDAMENADTTSGEASGLARRFRGVCQRALKPAQAYFEKRDAVRDTHRDALEALLTRAAELNSAAGDWKALAAMRHELSVALRSALDGLNPRDRGVFAKRLKTSNAAISTLLEAHAKEVENSKRRLIERATALAEHVDRESPRAARQLQQEWTALGEGSRPVDQRQWREFRAACDGIFGKLDAERKGRDEQATAARTRTLELVGDYEALTHNDIDSADPVRAALRDLDARWQESGSDDPTLVRRQRQARETIAARLKDSVRRVRLAAFSVALQKYKFLRGSESGSPESDARWSALPASSAAFDAALEARRSAALSAVDSVEVDSAELDSDELDSDQSRDARELLVQLEFLGGVETPAEDRALRMNQQVKRLSSRMRGSATLDPESELTSVLLAWFAQPPQADALEDRFEHAASAAIDALP